MAYFSVYCSHLWSDTLLFATVWSAPVENKYRGLIEGNIGLGMPGHALPRLCAEISCVAASCLVVFGKYPKAGEGNLPQNFTLYISFWSKYFSLKRGLQKCKSRSLIILLRRITDIARSVLLYRLLARSRGYIILFTLLRAPVDC